MIDYEKINLLQKMAEHGPFTLARYRQFYRYLSPRTRDILDVGCSTGRGGKVLKQLAPSLSISGLDCVKERLAALPTDVYSCALHCHSTRIECQNEAFDAIVAGEFIEHLHLSDVDRTLEEFFRVLRYGGRLLLTTPNPAYVRLRLTGRRVVGGAHLSEHYPETLRNRLEKCGFSDMIIKGSGRMSRFLGENCPVFSLYGSYLLIAEKHITNS